MQSRSTRALLGTMSWGLALWLVGYALAMAAFAFVPVEQIGWLVLPVLIPLTFVIAYRRLARANLPQQPLPDGRDRLAWARNRPRLCPNRPSVQRFGLLRHGCTDLLLRDLYRATCGWMAGRCCAPKGGTALTRLVRVGPWAPVDRNETSRAPSQARMRL